MRRSLLKWINFLVYFFLLLMAFSGCSGSGCSGCAGCYGCGLKVSVLVPQAVDERFALQVRSSRGWSDPRDFLSEFERLYELAYFHRKSIHLDGAWVGKINNVVYALPKGDAIRKTNDAPYRQYTKGTKLGKGGFGKVYEVTQVGDSDGVAKKLAVKVTIRTHPGDFVLDLRMIVPAVVSLELARLRSYGPLVHVHATMHDLYLQGRKFHMVVDRCDSDAWAHHLGKWYSATPRNRSKMVHTFAIHLLEGLAFMHKNGLAHRDIKLDNILYCGEIEGYKLMDFDLATRIPRPSTRPLHVFLGAVTYRSPQSLLEMGYGAVANDMWSAGLTIYEALRGPYFAKYHDFLKDWDKSQTVRKKSEVGDHYRRLRGDIDKQLRQPDLDAFDPRAAALLKLVQSLLQWEETKRPSAAKALAELRVD